MKQRLYNLYAVNETTGKTVCLTAYPDLHDRIVVLRSKFTKRKFTRLELREAIEEG